MPLPGIGIDLIEIERLERAIERRPRLERRLFSADEIAYAHSRRRPGQHLAARFAAKEAVVKALGLEGVSLTEIEILGGGAPRVRLGGAAARAAARAGVEVRVSLTHARTAAAAVAILVPLDEAAAAAAAADRHPAEERRQVSVLFADLSGYTAVAERMDPEAVKALVERCLRRLGQEVERFGGTVDKYIGDNVMALFGAPVAHEDDPERAVRAALSMQAAMAEVNEEALASGGASFSLRVGVNSGEVVAGTVGDAYTVMGDTVNVAARLQSAGRPGSVTVGERTWRATAEAIAYERLEPLELRGKAEPVPAWQALALRSDRPAKRLPSPGETPLIGREADLAALQALYDRTVEEGRPQLVTLVGEAGLGKTRLLVELERRLTGHEPAPTLRQGRCLPYGENLAYWALREAIREDFVILDEIDAEDPRRTRERLFATVRAELEAMTERAPVVLAFEDIHWADQGMLDLIEYIAQGVRGPLLVLCLAREELLERRPSWGQGRGNATTIAPAPLGPEQMLALIAAVAPGQTAGAAFGLADRAGGNPLFAEEMARRLAEGGAAGALPDSLHSLLAARLDALEPFERRLVQQAAVVGRTFWEGALAPLAAQEHRDLRSALRGLEEKDILVAEGPGAAGGAAGGALAGERELAFKHVLIRDVAYATLPKAVRARKHFEVGEFIEERAGDRGEEVVALLAEHYGRAATLAEEAGFAHDDLEPLHARALLFCEAAGDAAAAIYSNPEAFSHYQAARALRCTHHPATVARIGEKLGDVALRMGRAEAAIEVWRECLDHHRRQEELTRVGDLHRKIGAALWESADREGAIEHHRKGIDLLKDGPPCIELVRLYEASASLHMHTGDNMPAIYAAEKALQLAESLGETRAASHAHGIFGRVFGRLGDRVKARAGLERSVELARQAGPDETIRALLGLGYQLEVAEAEYEAAGLAYAEALELAERVGELPAQVELHSSLANLAFQRGDWDEIERRAERAAELTEREGLVGKLCCVHAMRGMLHWHRGEWDQAEAAYRQAHELAEQVGWSEVSFSALFGLAATLRDRGDQPGAAAALAGALDVCERAGLVAQSIKAMSAQADLHAAAGEEEQAREVAQQADRLAERLAR